MVNKSEVKDTGNGRSNRAEYLFLVCQLQHVRVYYFPFSSRTEEHMFVKDTVDVAAGVKK